MKALQMSRRQPFFSRGESWLRFNIRVLQEAEDPNNPLLERVKFLAITASNLDEFVEIRLASVMQRIEDGYSDVGTDAKALAHFPRHAMVGEIAGDYQRVREIVDGQESADICFVVFRVEMDIR